jgi:hypothetical protein
MNSSELLTALSFWGFYDDLQLILCTSGWFLLGCLSSVVVVNMCFKRRHRAPFVTCGSKKGDGSTKKAGAPSAVWRPLADDDTSSCEKMRAVESKLTSLAGVLGGKLLDIRVKMDTLKMAIDSLSSSVHRLELMSIEEKNKHRCCAGAAPEAGCSVERVAWIVVPNGRKLHLNASCTKIHINRKGLESPLASVSYNKDIEKLFCRWGMMCAFCFVGVDSSSSSSAATSSSNNLNASRQRLYPSSEDD